MAADPAVVEKVLGKVTQLRMESSDEEKAVLDALIVGRADPQVTGHQLAGEAADPGAADPGAVISGRVELTGEEYRAVEM